MHAPNACATLGYSGCPLNPWQTGLSTQRKHGGHGMILVEAAAGIIYNGCEMQHDRRIPGTFLRPGIFGMRGQRPKRQVAYVIMNMLMIGTSMQAVAYCIDPLQQSL